MVGEKQARLKEMLIRAGLRPSAGPIAGVDTWCFADKSVAAEIQRVWTALGGIGSHCLPRRKWDCELDNLIVELDEQLHFNRYRLLTLESPLYGRLPRFPLGDYKRYCGMHEQVCVQDGSWGGRWTNDSCERQFGTAGSPRSLDKNGSPRWKQRAFYDFSKDLGALVAGTSVVRIAVWDMLSDQGRTASVADILDSGGARWAGALRRLVESRQP